MATSAESIAFWNRHQVAEVSDDITEAESLELIEWRNGLYPGLLDLMPVAGVKGKTVLDFGCGPGHDTIQFLLHGAKRVYALDSSGKGLTSLRSRLRAHSLQHRCTVLPASELPFVPQVDHIHLAGVLHHLDDPVGALIQLRRVLGPASEIRTMVYSAESEVCLEDCKGDPELFRQHVDSGAPIANAWTRKQVRDIATAAGLQATYLGSYRVPSETTGPGLSSCWSLKR